jgi:hypothetical protein
VEGVARGSRAALPSPRRDQSWQPFSVRSLVDRHYCGEQAPKTFTQLGDGA